ncbi:coiled-coil domain-containing protein [Legionella fallonii]|uniref:Uncharacterized protein n=1 Tax=Legionella fallonii LLAP-10 TaxID=1212491 RepID=A0A098FZS6_9GAMM|nr:hypothetical protein [Legionella fallonii]CEG55737.1 protein of unknown function [8 coiled-coil domains] [Legionella fallonii LLAP-10]
MRGRSEADPVEGLVKKQAELAGKVSLLQGEIRRLRDEVTNVETTKRQVDSNAVAINGIVKEIEGLQKNIKDEINKLTVKSREIKNSTTELSSSIQSVPDAPQFDGVPPPPPPFNFTPKAKGDKTGNTPTTSTPERPQTNTDPSGDMVQQLKDGGTTLRKSGGTQVTEKTQEQIEQEKREAIQRYEQSIRTKEAEIERLLSQFGELSTKLKTAQASQGEYQQALESQEGLLTQLKQKKEAMEGKLKDVKGQVGTELEKIETKRKLEEEENQRKAEEERAKQQSSSEEVSQIPDAPPPPPDINIPPPPKFNVPPPPAKFNVPPPPPMGGLSSAKKEKVTLSSDNNKVQEPSPSTTTPPVGKGDIDLGELQRKGIESQKRQEARAEREYLTDKLIDLAVTIGDEDLDEVELTENQQQLLDLIGEDGLDDLRKSLSEGVAEIRKKNSTPGMIDPSKITGRRAAISGGNSDVTAAVQKNKDKREVRDAVEKFIAQSPQNTTLLETSKEIKQREEAEAKRLEEARKIDEARKSEERNKQLAEEKRIAEEKRAREVQQKLNDMGAKEGIVNPTGVQEAESSKARVIQEVTSKQTALDTTDEFLQSIENELSSGIRGLQEAESSRDSALETVAAMKKEEVVTTTVQTERVVDVPQQNIHQEVQQSVVIEPPKKDEELIAEARQEEIIVQPTEIKDPTEVVVKQEERVPDLKDPNVTTAKKEEAIIDIAIKPQPDTPEIKARKATIHNLGIDGKIEGMMKKANALEKSGFTGAAKEAQVICNKLINLRDDYIYERKGKNDIIKECDDCVCPENTKKLSESRGILGAIHRFVQSVKEAFTGVSAVQDSKKSSMERVSELKGSINALKAEIEKEQLTSEASDEVEHRSSIQSSM